MKNKEKRKMLIELSHRHCELIHVMNYHLFEKQGTYRLTMVDGIRKSLEFFYKYHIRKDPLYKKAYDKYLLANPENHLLKKEIVKPKIKKPFIKKKVVDPYSQRDLEKDEELEKKAEAEMLNQEQFFEELNNTGGENK